MGNIISNIDLGPAQILDIIFAAIILLFLIRGIVKGLVMSISWFAGMILGILGGMTVAKLFSGVVSEKLIQPWINKALSGSAENRDLFSGIAIDNNGNLLSEAKESISNILDGANLPEFSLSGALDGIGQKIAEKGSDLLEAASQVISDRVAYLILFVIAFFVIQIIVYIVFKALDLVAKAPGISTLNRWGGALLGIVTGLLAAFVSVWFISTFFPSATAKGGLLSPDVVRDSLLSRYFFSFIDLIKQGLNFK